MATRKQSRRRGLSRADEAWRWVIRLAGLIGFFALLLAFLGGRDVPVWWVTLIGGMFGIDGLAGLRNR